MCLGLIVLVLASHARELCITFTGPPEAYRASACNAADAADAGRYAEAISHLERALDDNLFEVPNYELLPDLALASCKNGGLARGRQLLADYRCMLLVEQGGLRCYVGGTEDGAVDPERSPGLTDRCFETMCGEIYLSYYEDPTPEMLRAVEKSLGELPAIEAACANDPQR